MAGVESTGFVLPTLDSIKAELEAAFKAALGANLNTLATSPFGQVIAIMAEREFDIFEAMAAVYGSQFPSTASGASLDNVMGYTGARRLDAEKSTVLLTAMGTPTTVLPAGRVASVDGTPAARFETLEEATIMAATAWADTTPYATGDRVTNSSRIYVCITAGTSAGSGGPTTTDSDITDGTVHWRYIGEGDGLIDVEAEAETAGATVANAYTLTTIETAVSGWESVVNLADAEVGTEEEADAEARVRREELLRSTGDATLDAIRADILSVEDVTECKVFENTSSVTDGDGVPGKAFEAVVRGGEESDIIAAIWASKPVGIETHGNVSGSVEDSQGTSHDVEFSRPTTVTIHTAIEVTVDPDTFPDDGEDQIRAKVVEYGDALNIGDDVVTSALYPKIFEVSGVLDVTEVLVGTVDPPVASTNVTITSRQLASFDTANVDVTAT
jgi:uncharacterized phage protein gp47/JayE